MRTPNGTGRVEFRLSEAANAKDYLAFVGLTGFNRLNSGRTLAKISNSFLRNDHDGLIRNWRDQELGQTLPPVIGKARKKRLNLFGMATNAF